VLEIGSGKGGLQGVGGDYVALDYSFTALASHIAPAHQRVCGTAERLPFRDASFRFVFSITALEHVPRAAEAFEEIDRVLKPGGIAYLWPAWHCVQYNCEGIPVRPYRDLTLRQKLVKLSLPARRHALVKGAASLPARLVRRTAWVLSGRPPTTLRFGKLKPDYETFWLSDSDAASRLDSHEGTLFFHSRGYEMLRPGQALSRQLFARHEPVIARKAANATPAPR
jgi:SAM-dependent methyltransferase